MGVSQADNQILTTITSTIEVFGKTGLPGLIDIMKNIFIEIEKVAANMLITTQRTLQKNFVELINCAIKATKSLIEGNLSEASKEAMKALNLLTPILEILSLIPPLALITGVLLALIYFCDNKKLLAVGALLGVLFVGIKWLMKIKSLSNVSASFSKVLNSANKLKLATPNAKAISPSKLKSNIVNAKKPVVTKTESNISIKSTSSTSVSSTNMPMSKSGQVPVVNKTTNISKTANVQQVNNGRFGEITGNQKINEISGSKKIERTSLDDIKIDKVDSNNIFASQSESLINKGQANGLLSGAKELKNAGSQIKAIAEDSPMPKFDSNNYWGINTNNTGNNGLNGLLDNGLSSSYSSIKGLHTYTPSSMIESQAEIQKYTMLGKLQQSTPKSIIY